jgi:hypothetical protein
MRPRIFFFSEEDFQTAGRGDFKTLLVMLGNSLDGC